MPKVNARRVEKTYINKDPNVVKDINFYQEINKVTNTVYATNNWIKSLKTFWKQKNYNSKIEEVNNTHDLNLQLAEYVANMKQKNGKEYAINSIRTAIAAFYHFLNKNSVISR